MEPFPIPVRPAPLVGPGSQPEDDATLDYMPMPKGMNTFEMPHVPEQADPQSLAGTRDLLAQMVAALAAWNPADAAARPVIDLAGVAAPVLGVLNEVLGEGEVSIRIDGVPALRMQESVFAGLWRCCELDAGGRLLRDWLEAGDVPRAVGAAAQAAAAAAPVAVEVPAGAMNAPALLTEIGAALRERAGAPADAGASQRGRQINLTLLPMSPEDHALLERALPVGPVAMISRGFGNCHVTSTLTRDVWRVQYFNTMNTLILNTLEVVGMPEVAIASAEDLDDTRSRLAELVQWLDQSAAEAAGG